MTKKINSIFSFNGERYNYIILLTPEPPVTDRNHLLPIENNQPQRNGVHACDFQYFIFFKKLQGAKKIVQLKSKPSNGFTFGLSQESRYSTILISMNRGQIQAAYCLL